MLHLSMASLQMVITPIQQCVAVYTAFDNSWQLPNGAITIITQELAKHESSFADGFFKEKYGRIWASPSFGWFCD